jgi:ABC-type phosphate transport system substrate-binding protein
MKAWTHLPIFCATALALLMSAPARADELALVVNKASFVTLLNFSELKHIYLGEKKKWPDGKAIVVATVGPPGPEYQTMLKVIYGMSDAEFKRHFLQAKFTGSDAAPPRMFGSAAALKAFISSTPGAIGCVKSHEVDATVKTIRLDGAAPGDAGYKLAAQ